MRIAIGQLWQETNTFNPIPTSRADFESFGILRGDNLVEKMAESNEIGGFIQSLRLWPEKPEIVGLVRLPAWPSGQATAETFRWLHDELISSLKNALPVEGILLALHGALAADQHPDVEGEILAAVRAVVGPQIPLVATLDLHANITPLMSTSADALVLYHTIPHIDLLETGQRAANLVRRVLIDRAKPCTAFVKVPCVLPAERANTELPSGASADLKRKLQALESRPEVLTAGLATVQPWLDIPNLGSAVVITTNDQPQLATELASEIASEVWSRRHEYLPELVSIQDAVARSYANPSGLVVLSDAADATTSGAPGDSVWLLQELLKYDWPRPVLLTVVAPNIAEQAEQLGRGQIWTGDIGGIRDARFGIRIPLSAMVENVFDARFTTSGHLGSLAIDMGRSALLRTGQIYIVVTSKTGPHFSPMLFQAAGLDPFAAAVLVAKSPAGFRAAYASRAAAIYSVRAPGCAPSDFWKFEYKYLDRPLWPWDEIPNWQPQPILFQSQL
ncbi:MAG TPA: M81 family metallopeptidase [Pirellulaceae bacterium]|jgi:microcystin degradation protein MlrC